jgi:hypothetical protein
VEARLAKITRDRDKYRRRNVAGLLELRERFFGIRLRRVDFLRASEVAQAVARANAEIKGCRLTPPSVEVNWSAGADHRLDERIRPAGRSYPTPHGLREYGFMW